MKNISTLFFFCFIAYMLPLTAMADIVVIVNSDNTIDSLKRGEVIDIYMGRHLNFSNQQPASPLDLPISSVLRLTFYKQLVGKSVAEVNAYWARLLFTGRASPPRPMKDSKTVLSFVKDNKSAIAYLDSKDLNNQVKVVYRFEAP